MLRSQAPSLGLGQDAAHLLGQDCHWGSPLSQLCRRQGALSRELAPDVIFGFEPRCPRQPRMWLEGSGWRARQTSGSKCTTRQPTKLGDFGELQLSCLQVVTRVPQSTQAEMEEAVESAKAAHRTWSRSSPMARWAELVSKRSRHLSSSDSRSCSSTSS